MKDDLLSYDRRYPSVEDLKRRARGRIPRFAFDYLEGGCNGEVNLGRNEADLQAIELMPQYLKRYTGMTMRTELFGHVYDALIGNSDCVLMPANRVPAAGGMLAGKHTAAYLQNW